MTDRRTWLAAIAALALAPLLGLRGRTARATESFAVTHTDAEWRHLLTPSQYRILREAGTEMPFSSPLNNEHRHGTFACAGCNLGAYASSTKFDSGTGWPSFYDHLANAIETASDDSMLMSRTEVHCQRCGGHLGHVFNDGPRPTGLRYCMNGDAMLFHPA